VGKFTHFACFSSQNLNFNYYVCFAVLMHVSLYFSNCALCWSQQELSADVLSVVDDNLSAEDSDSNVSLLGSVVWDVYQEYEQLEALRCASQSNIELGFEKVAPVM
jgi:hypothetical protein